MHEKLQEILPKLEDWLLDKIVESFKIGFTADVESRESDYKNDGYTQLYPIAFHNDKKIIRQCESDMIEYFTDEKKTKCAKKCQNDKNKAGTGNSSVKAEKYYLYIAIYIDTSKIETPVDTHWRSILLSDIDEIDLSK